ncbi:homoserine dehydrogenase [Microbacterium sp. NPDC077644]|uniref:homoserine dehydrogenase n=1 Tax=Microbacterium sp. NPDC077644 TaxID=3155055 RepID=UPI00344BD66A
MPTHRLALIGFGNVNRALAETLISDADRLRDEAGVTLEVVAITDLRLGSLVQPEGIDLTAVLAMPPGSSFATRPGGSSEADNARVIAECPADIVVEATYTNPAGGEPATSHVRWALEAGKHVATTNKGPIASHLGELENIARRRGVRLAYEGTVMSGTPVLRLAADLLAGSGVRAVAGILNGTSNFVLGRMEAGLSMDAAIAEAQGLGYAEADPSADIGGDDVRLKVAILAGAVLGVPIAPDDVDTTGIAALTPAEIVDAAADQHRWKLIGSAARRADGTIDARVAPQRLPMEHPLAGIDGATNAVTFETEMLGTVSVSGPGAGRRETAFAILSDIIDISRTSSPEVRA